MEATINDMLTQLEAIKKAIKDKFLNLPQNKVIKPLSNNCFTIQSSQLQKGILSPYYYDFKFQYKIISELVEEKPIENIIPFLKEVIKTKTLIYKKSRYRINDEVTKNIEAIIK